MKIFFLILFLFLFNQQIYANNLFETIFYKIEFSSDNIQDDKINEINKIKSKSILNIFKNTLSEDDFLKVNDFLTDDLINTFIKNIVINNEKIIDERYISEIKINFNKKKILEFFRIKKLPYVEYHPDKFLLIILENNDINNNLFTKNNSYYKFFKESLKKNNYFFRIPNLDINDRFILNEDDILNRDFNKINNFFKKYNSNENIIVIVKEHKDEIIYNLILFSDENILENEKILKKNQIDSFFKTLENDTINLWKQINKIQNETLNFISCEINYFNMLELKEIRNNLKNVSVIKNFTTKKLSYKNIEYDINYYGNTNILIKIFKMNKLKIYLNKNKCVIRLI